jgi:apolipoprotein N-acyltransferase
MRSIAHAVLLLWGWRRLAAAVVAGALSALAQAPVFAAPVLFATIPVLVWLIDGSVSPGRRGVRRYRPAAAVGWCFGFGYFLAGLYWIGAAFLVEADVFGWMMPFAVVALPAGLALFFALGAVIARVLWVEGPVRILALAIGLTVAEWLRGHVFTGFPWILLGQPVAFSDVTAQAAAVVGVYGLTFLGLVVFAAPALLGDDPGTRPRWRAAMLALAGLLLVADVVYGAIRLSGTPAVGDDALPGVRIRIVQPNINQAQKWSPEFREATLKTLEELSDLRTDPETLGVMSFTHVVWPETALPFFLTEEPEALARIAALLPPGTTLITGAPRVEPTADGRNFYNSVYVIDDTGGIVGAYDKGHLVPFGEYLPFQEVLNQIGLRQIVPAVGGFSAGPGRRTLDIPGAPAASPLVCYEVIFSGSVVAPGEDPGFLLNLTNDGWFGLTSGPHQHLDQARLRAIEQGIPVLRAANTGISAMIDSYGRAVGKLGLGERGVLDVVMPTAKPSVVFPRMGAYLLLTFHLISFILLIAGGRKLSWKR